MPFRIYTNTTDWATKEAEYHAWMGANVSNYNADRWGDVNWNKHPDYDRWHLLIPVGHSDTGVELTDPSWTFANDLSVLFDGVDEYVNIDTVLTALASTTVGTWSFWIKPVDATPSAVEMPLSFSDTSANAYLHFLINTNGRIQYISRIAAEIKCSLRTDVAAFSDGVWSHFALVQDGVSPVLYVNGVAVAQTFIVSTDKTWWFNDDPNLDNGRIGDSNRNNLGEVLHFNGNIDEVIFVNRALTQPQIADIYNLGVPKGENAIANGVSLFKMGDGDTFPTLTDNIGDNDATMVNMEAGDIEEDVIG